MLDSRNETENALLIERLKTLEYAIRTSITVREDQEDDLDPLHKQEAERCGINVDAMTTKGDLLSVVQTAVRAAEGRATR